MVWKLYGLVEPILVALLHQTFPTTIWLLCYDGVFWANFEVQIKRYRKMQWYLGKHSEFQDVHSYIRLTNIKTFMYFLDAPFFVGKKKKPTYKIMFYCLWVFFFWSMLMEKNLCLWRKHNFRSFTHIKNWTLI
jgi:hypothetical protein